MIRNVFYSANTILSLLIAKFFWDRSNGHLRILIVCFFLALGLYQGVGLFLSISYDRLIASNPLLWKTIWTLCIIPLEIVLVWFLIYCLHYSKDDGNN